MRANGEGHVAGYGDDAWTERACDRMRALFETDCAVFFVFSGTAANALALAQICRSYHAVIAHAESHVATDEAGRRRVFQRRRGHPHRRYAAGQADARGGRARWQPSGRGFHSVKPRVLSLTQATEMGTVYTLRASCAALTEVARRHGLKVHMDGARFANAVAALGCSPADLSWRAGVDVLCFGGVKNGLAAGEAVLFFDHGPRARVRVARQAGGPAQLQDAAGHGALARPAGERRVAHERAARQRHGAAAGRAHRRRRGRAADGAGRKQRRVRRDRRATCRTGCAARAGASIPGDSGLPPDVRLGYGSRRRWTGSRPTWGGRS